METLGVVLRIFTWILVALLLHFIDEKLLRKKNRVVWLVLLLTSLIIYIIISDFNQVLDDIMIVMIAISTVSFLSKKDKKIE